MKLLIIPTSSWKKFKKEFWISSKSWPVKLVIIPTSSRIKFKKYSKKKEEWLPFINATPAERKDTFHPNALTKKNTKRKKKTNSAEEIKPKFTCFTCGEPGHYSTNCPEKENVKPAPTKSNGCFNCGEEGHWANKCPHEKQKKKTAQKRSACYTCGETGHWTKDCPKIEEVIQTSDIEDNEPPKKIKKERKNQPKNLKKKTGTRKWKSNKKYRAEWRESTIKTCSWRNPTSIKNRNPWKKRIISSM